MRTDHNNNQKKRIQLQIHATYVVKLQNGSTLTCCTECVGAHETNTKIIAPALNLVSVLTDESRDRVRSAQGDIEIQSGQFTLL